MPASLAGGHPGDAPGTMGNAVPEPTPVLMGYADRLSVQAGDTIRFMVSCEASSFDARLVRLIHGDNNPAGPGYREEEPSSPADGTYPGKRQIIAAGSYVRVPGGGALDLTNGLTVQAWIWPTTPAKPGGQAIIACWSELRGFVFGLDDTGHLCLDLGSGSETKRLTHTGAPLEPWRWAFVAATHDPATGLARLYQASTEPYSAAQSTR